MQNAPWASFSNFAVVAPSDVAPVSCHALLVNVTTAGNLTLKVSTDQAAAPASVAIPMPIGLFVLPIELNQGFVMATGTTIVGTVVALA